MHQENVVVTELELQILQQIWEQENEATVAAIVDNWPETKRPGYTTILKTLQKMEKKGIVGHRPDGKKISIFPESIEGENYKEKAQFNYRTGLFRKRPFICRVFCKIPQL